MSQMSFKEALGRGRPGPIEREMRGRLSKLVDTKYRSDFDWSVYDRISQRYGEGEPRGGVVYKTTFKLANHHSSCTRCHYAFELDTYGRGCIHDCTYCYAKDHLTAHGMWNRPMPFPVDLSEVRRILYTVFETSKPCKWREILEARIPLRIGSMSDAFMWSERRYGVSKELLNILEFYEYPYIVFTRSDLVAQEQYLKVLDPRLCSIQMSVSGGNELLTKLIEPGAPSIKRRLNAVRLLNDSGIRATIRLNPLFPIYPDGYFTDYHSVVERFGGWGEIPKLDIFDFDFISQLSAYKVGSVLAGFVRLSPAAIKSMSKAMSVDLKQFFQPEVLRKNGDKHYSDNEIRFYYEKIRQQCKAHGMRFTTCYIGNGIKDYFQYQHLWSDRGDCCDARAGVETFGASAQNIDWDLRRRFSPNKECSVAKKIDESFESRSLKLIP